MKKGVARNLAILVVSVIFVIVLFATVSKILADIQSGASSDKFYWVRGGDSGKDSSLGVACDLPTPYDEIFRKAGDKFQVQPALIAAIFYGGEHNNNWPNPNGPWASSPKGAQGPFQFIPSTWKSNKQDGNGDGIMDVQNLWDAAFGAAHLLANIGAGGMTIDESKLMDAASKYNSGRSWEEVQRRGIKETLKYVPRVMEAFHNFYCPEGGNVV